MCSVTDLCPTLCDPRGTVAHQTPLSVGLSRQEYRSGLLLPPPGDIPDSKIKPMFPSSLALASRFFPTVPPGKPSPSLIVL